MGLLAALAAVLASLFAGALLGAYLAGQGLPTVWVVLLAVFVALTVILWPNGGRRGAHRR